MERDLAPDPQLTDLSNTHDDNISASSYNSVSGQNTLVNQTPDDTQIEKDLEASKSGPEASPSTSLPTLEHHYLTFTTNVPTTPVIPTTLTHILKDLPPCPNLRKYENPYTWSRSRKTLTTILSCSLNATAAFASGAYASPERQLTAKWGINHVVYNVGITIFTAGFGIAPMLLAPFSEINGRRPVFIATGTLFVLNSLFCGITDSFGGMLAARFFLGVGGSTFSTMGAGILADVWATEERNTPMALFTGATLFGTGIGPLVSGIVAEKLLWRWVFYIQVFISGFLMVVVATFFQETRGSIILSHKAKTLNKWYEALEEAGAIGVSVPSTSPPLTTVDDPEKHIVVSTAHHTPTTKRIRYRVLADEQRASLLKLLSISLYRPIRLLFTEPVVFWFSVWISFAWSVLYLQFGSVPLVFSTVYNFTLAQTGYVFIAMCAGGIFSTLLSIYQDKWAVKHYPRFFKNPEGRLLFTCIESAFVPIGLFIFGWTCYPSIHWIAPTIALGVVTMGIFSVFLAVFNYSADVYLSYASSALAASGLCRNLLGGSFPLVTHALFNDLGFQAASSLLGGIAAALTLVPWVLVKWGPAIRRSSRIASTFLVESQGQGGQT